MAIDRGDWHFEDAGTWERACRHIALFLFWAAERGLAAPSIEAKAMAKGPTQYFIKQCDTKLWADDLGKEGNRFVVTEYDAYLKEVHARAAALGIDDYDLPEDRETAKHFFAWLDARLAAWRAKKSMGAAAHKKQAAKKAKATPKKHAAKKKAAVKKATPKKSKATPKKKPAKKKAERARR
jgi:hypothetical protein